MPATVRTSLLIALAALCAHAGALSAGWIWDDGDYITANRIVQSPDGFLTLWLPGATPQFYPLVFLGFWIEHAIVGNDPWLYHANNMLLHAGSALLLWLVLRRIGVPLAAWIAVVFAVHPMGVESVAWATERKNTQSLLLALASVLAFLRAEKIDAREPAPAEEAAGQGAASGSLAPYAFALLLYIAALLSKTTAVFVAPSLVLIALATRRSIDSRFVVRVAPYFVIGAALGLFTHDFLGLTLGADKKNRSFIRRQLSHEFQRFRVQRHGFFKIDDMYLVAVTENVRRHFRVPVAGLVPEMDAAFQHFTHD